MVESRTVILEDEIKDYLVEDGYVQGTPTWMCEKMRRFEHADGLPGQYYERHDWGGDRRRANSS